MRRIVVWLASTVTVVVLLFGYHTSTDSAATPPPSASSSASPGTGATSSGSGGSGPGGSGGSGSSTTPSPTPSGSASSSPSPGSTSSGTRTVTGSVAQTRWGPVQVQITTQTGRVTDVEVLQRPSQNPRDAEINDHALPILVQETLSAQSADIDMVSGATVTSDGYVQSLQAALDAAGI